MYVPQAQLTDAENAFLARSGSMAWVIQTQAEPHALVPAIQEQLRRATGLSVSDALSMDQAVSRSTGQQRFNMLLMTVLKPRRCYWRRSEFTD